MQLCISDQITFLLKTSQWLIFACRTKSKFLVMAKTIPQEQARVSLSACIPLPHPQAQWLDDLDSLFPLPAVFWTLLTSSQL